jgi:hypothetical protein
MVIGFKGSSLFDPRLSDALEALDTRCTTARIVVEGSSLGPDQAVDRQFRNPKLGPVDPHTRRSVKRVKPILICSRAVGRVLQAVE